VQTAHLQYGAGNNAVNAVDEGDNRRRCYRCRRLSSFEFLDSAIDTDASQLSIILIISIIPTADHAHWTTHEDDDEDDGTEETFAGSCGHVLLYDVMSSSPALWLVLRFVSLHYGLDRPLEDFDPNKPTFWPLNLDFMSTKPKSHQA